MADGEGCLAIFVLGGTEEAHSKDTADKGGRQEKHGQDLDVSERSAVLMGRTRD